MYGNTPPKTSPVKSTFSFGNQIIILSLRSPGEGISTKRIPAISISVFEAIILVGTASPMPPFILGDFPTPAPTVPSSLSGNKIPIWDKALFTTISRIGEIL